MSHGYVTEITRRARRFGRRLASTAVISVLSAAAVAVVLETTGISAPLARIVYDAQLRARAPSPWPTDVLVAPIDEAATRAYGRWPWPRRQVADVLNRIRALGARTLVVDLFYAAPDSDDPLLADALDGTVLALPPGTTGIASAEAAWMETRMLPIPAATLAGKSPIRVSVPYSAFARRARAVGHAQLYRQPDGRVRTYAPLLEAEGLRNLVPSLALAAVLAHEDVAPRDVRFDGRMLSFGGRSFRLHGGELLLDFVPGADGPVGGPGGPPRLALEGIFDPGSEAGLRSRLEGSLVVVYVEAASVDREPTPISRETTGGLVHAYAIRTLATGRAPQAVPLLPVLGFLAAAVLLLVPWLTLRSFTGNLAVFAALIAVYLAAGFALVRASDLFLPVATPLPFLVLSGVFLAGRAHHVLRRSERTSRERLRTAPASGDAASAPRGRVCLAFTDIEGSTTLWENAYPAMRDGLELHDRILREALVAHGGYEVKTDGDAFMVAFPSSESALRWALDVQQRLFDCAWPRGLLDEPEAAPIAGEAALPVQRGLRVRMGLHVGLVEARPNPLTGRMDYFGPTVNRTARLVSAAHGGQILLTEDVAVEVDAMLSGPGAPRFDPLGSFVLRGFEEPVPLFQVVPASLRTRRFEPPRAEPRRRA